MSHRIQAVASNMKPDGRSTQIKLSVNHSITVNRAETETTFIHMRTAWPCVSEEVVLPKI